MTSPYSPRTPFRTTEPLPIFKSPFVPKIWFWSSKRGSGAGFCFQGTKAHTLKQTNSLGAQRSPGQSPPGEKEICVFPKAPLSKAKWPFVSKPLTPSASGGGVGTCGQIAYYQEERSGFFLHFWLKLLAQHPPGGARPSVSKNLRHGVKTQSSGLNHHISLGSGTEPVHD